VWKIIDSNCCLTIHEGAEEAGISKTTCYEILTENLGMHHIAAKFIPHQLSEDQKQNRYVAVSKELVDLNDENFLKNIVTDDDTWFYGCDMETKVQSSQWVLKSPPRPKKAWQVQSSVKVMLNTHTHTHTHTPLYIYVYIECNSS
jgi:hypothetical protein